LPRDRCAADERCVPCSDPLTGQPTGACTTSCDVPADPPFVLACPWPGPPVFNPGVLPRCGRACGEAHCIDGDHIPADLRGMLASCGTGAYCTPDSFIED